MKARKILMPLVALTTSLTAFSLDVTHDNGNVYAGSVPDVLVLYGTSYGDSPYAKAVISDIDSIRIDAADNSLYIVDKYSKSSPDGDAFTVRWDLVYKPHTTKRNFSGAYFIYRGGEKLQSPRLDDTQVINRNSILVAWTAVAGSDGYEVRYTHLKDTVTQAVPAGQTTLQIDNLEYMSKYNVAVRAIHPLSKEDVGFEWLNSDWSGRRDFRPINWGYTTEERPEVPEVITVTSITNHSFKVDFSLACNYDGYRENFQVDENGNFVVTSLSVTSEDSTAVPEAFKNHILTAEELAQGYIIVNGLKANTQYTVNVYNDNIPEKVDAVYNKLMPHTIGSLDEPIVIEDGNIADATSYYFSHPSWPEGQMFYLRGGKEYNIGYSNMELTKGIILETCPEDLDAGKRAKINMGDGNLDEYNRISAYNFMLGINNSTDTLSVGKIAFKNIDFDVPNAVNYGESVQASKYQSGNYLFNTYSNIGPVNYESLEFSNCTFHNFIRGFIRLQGREPIIINKLSIDGCLFYNCGYYDANGRGYAWFAGNGTGLSNMYNDFSFTNNTIYDSPRTCLISDNDKSVDYAENVKWNIRIENNTFINFSTRSSGRNFFQTRYVPGGSHFTFKRNLIVLAAADTDKRPLNQGGADIREVKGDGKFTFDIADNYSLGCREVHMTDNGIFTGSRFSDSRYSFGGDQFIGGLASGNKDDLIVKALTEGDKVLKATDVFTSPLPPYAEYDSEKPNRKDHAAPDDIFNALKYQFNPAIIIEKNVGDPRWRK